MIDNANDDFETYPPEVQNIICETCDYSCISGTYTGHHTITDKTIDIIRRYPDILWNWYSISYDFIIPVEIIVENGDMPWDWYRLSSNTNFTIDDIALHKELPWDWEYISRESKVTIENIILYRDIPWDWVVLSGNSSLSLKNVLDHPELPWVWYSVYTNYHFTFQLFLNRDEYNPFTDTCQRQRKKKYLDIPLDFSIIDYYFKKQCLSWNRYFMSVHPSITSDIVKANPDFPWSLDGLMANPNNIYNNNICE